ncbi:MAG TPA: hypothetical protein VGH93_02840 [Solirubrobacteraceae bacterium]
MTRVLRVALLGWSLGFLIAGLVGLTLPGNHPLASTFLVAAGAGTVLLGVLLVAGGLRAGRRATIDDVDDVKVIATPAPATPIPHEATAVEAAAAAAAAAERAATARIAELEALLALEEQRLDEVIQALAAEDAVETADDVAPGAQAQSDAAAEEPVLRAQVVDTLVELIGEKDVIGELEVLTAPGQAPPAEPPAPTVGRPAASEQKRLQKPRAKRRRVEKPGPVDKRAERVGKRDLRRGRARDTQQVGRTDEDG